MRFQFTLIPVVTAALLPAGQASAEIFLSVEQAQNLIFPGAQFTPADFRLSPADVTKLRTVSRTLVFRPQVKMWKVSTGGWFFIDQVMGRDDRITYAIGLDAPGKVKSIEILECDGGYARVRSRAWRATFAGKGHQDGHLSTDIPSISGTSLSSAHITDGVTRVLATYALFVAPQAR